MIRNVTQFSTARCGRSAVIAVAMFLAATTAFAADVPYLTGRVVDNAEVLKPATRDQIAALLKAHEDKTSNQIAVLTLSTLDGESVEGYATRVFEGWKLGQKGKDNGVLVVVVPNDRKMRIEVGYGLEGTLPDVGAARIIRNVMTPAFKAGDYDKGVGEGVAAIVATLEGRGDAAGAQASLADTGGGSGGGNSLFEFKGPDLPWYMRILLGCFIFGIIGIFTVVGVATPGVGWFLYVFLIPFWAMFPMVIIGTLPALILLGIYVVGYPIVKVLLSRSDWYRKAAAELKTTGHAKIGGFVFSSGGGESGFSSGGGDSGGGFSGGGGDSGGGGASGSW
jgi:uncharacterized protein